VSQDEAQVACARRARRFHVGCFLDLEHAGAHDARKARDPRNTDRDHGVVEARAQCGSYGQRQKNARKSHEGIDEPHEEAIDQTAVRTRDYSDERSDRGRDRDRDEAHLKGDAGSIDHAAEDVASEIVGTHEMSAGGSLHNVTGNLNGIVRGEERRQQGDQTKHDENRETQHSTRVAQEPRKRRR
jgi:hypothetical protein